MYICIYIYIYMYINRGTLNNIMFHAQQYLTDKFMNVRKVFIQSGVANASNKCNTLYLDIILLDYH